MTVKQWSKSDLDNAMLYGVCLVCMTPQEMRKTVTEKGGKTSTHFELVRPCGHTEGDIDAELAKEDA
jgi:hypothetical protein